MRRSDLLVFALAAMSAACGENRLEGRELAEPETAVAEVVDSVVPIPLALARFRADVAAVPTGLEGGRESPEALAREVVRLLESADTLGFQDIALDRAEFAYLYYETSPLAEPPYELPPALMWFRMQQGNRTGVFRLLREFGGRPIDYAGFACDDPPVEQGGNRIWSGCRLRIGPHAAAREVRLFGAIIERDGEFKVLSFENGF